MSDQIRESDFIFYRGEDGNVHAQVILGDGTVWVSQKTLSDIFGVVTSTINYHISELIKAEEIDEATIRKIRIVQDEGGRQIPREIMFYSLDVILSVGYRVNSYKASKFRQWSSRILTEYLTKGYVLDDERLKQGNKLFGKDHFKELLERVREIRASERMFYEKVTDLYALSEDYDKIDPQTQDFFRKVQAKLEYAITCQTPAEIIKSRVNSGMPNMGLKSWKNAKRDGKIMLADAKIAKNYLSSDELKSLNTLVSAFLDHAEMLYNKQKIMKMSDWAGRLDKFLEFNEYKVLKDGGSIKKQLADAFAESEFNKFRIHQDKVYKSDFNNFLEGVSQGKNFPNEKDLYKEKSNEPLSDFNSKLSTALNYKPDSKKNMKSMKTCPKCGSMVDKKLNYCNNNIMDENGDVIASGYSFGAIDGNEKWDGI